MVLIFLHISTVHIRKLLRKCAFTGKFKDNILVLNRKNYRFILLSKASKTKANLFNLRIDSHPNTNFRRISGFHDTY